MSPLFQNFLILHVLSGLLGIVSFAAVLLGLMKNASLRKLKITSFFGLLAFLVSWFYGGYYYAIYYGDKVKPLIKAGRYSWAHNVIMETKEHIFLFLPFLAAVLFLVIWLAGEDINKEQKLKKGTTALALSIVILGIAITLMGLAISGAAQ